MPTLIQTNFTSGELSPRIKGRVDLEQYSAGADQIVNFVVLPAGGITRRTGTHYAGPLKSSLLRSRCIPFVVADLTAYVLELGNLYLRVWRNRAPVTDTTGAPVELVTPWQTADLRSLRYAQSADVLYITHVAYPPMALSRTAASAFTLAKVAFTNGPYDVENTGDIGATGAAPDTSAAASGAPTTPAAGGAGTPTSVEGHGSGSNSEAGGANSMSSDQGGDPGGDGQGGQGGNAGGDVQGGQGNGVEGA